MEGQKLKEVPMPLTTIIPAIPADVKKALQDGLPSFESSAGPDLKETLERATQALEVFTLGIPDVLPSGVGMKAAKASGWRIGVSNRGAAIAADIYTMAGGGKVPLREGTPRLACIRRGPQVEIMLRAITTLTLLPMAGQLPSSPFNVSLLTMLGLYTDALWLRPKISGSTPSLIVPFHTLVDNIRLNHAYTEQELIALLRPIAEKWVSIKSKLSRANGARLPFDQSPSVLADA
jgi:hypothetical protein